MKSCSLKLKNCHIWERRSSHNFTYEGKSVGITHKNIEKKMSFGFLLCDIYIGTLTV